MRSPLFSGPRGLWGPGKLGPTLPSQFAVPNGLIAYYGFDPDCISGTNLLDLTANANTATISGSPPYAAGQVGGALAFSSGGSTYALTPLSTGIYVNSGTISWWVYNTAAYNSGTERPFWGANSSGATPQFAAEVYSDNKYYFGWNNSTYGDQRISFAASTSNYFQNKWTHYVLSWDTTVGKTFLFINGALVSSAALSGTVAPTSAPSLAKITTALSNTTLAGSLDDWRAYNRAISPGEVQLLYQAGLSGRRDAPTVAPLIRLSSTQYNQSATWTTVSALTTAKQVGKAAPIASTSALTPVKSVRKIPTWSTTSALSAAKQVGKAATWGTVSALTISAIKVKLASIAISTVSALTALKQAGKAVPISNASALTAVKSVAHAVAFGSTSALTAVKRGAHTATIATTSALTALKQVSKHVSWGAISALIAQAVKQGAGGTQYVKTITMTTASAVSVSAAYAMTKIRVGLQLLGKRARMFLGGHGDDL